MFKTTPDQTTAMYFIESLLSHGFCIGPCFRKPGFSDPFMKNIRKKINWTWSIVHLGVAFRKSFNDSISIRLVSVPPFIVKMLSYFISLNFSPILSITIIINIIINVIELLLHFYSKTNKENW